MDGEQIRRAGRRRRCTSFQCLSAARRDAIVRLLLLLLLLLFLLLCLPPIPRAPRPVSDAPRRIDEPARDLPFALPAPKRHQLCAPALSQVPAYHRGPW